MFNARKFGACYILEPQLRVRVCTVLQYIHKVSKRNTTAVYCWF